MKKNYLSFLGRYKNLVGSTEGLTVDQIDSIELYFNVKLPQAYRDYLPLYGKESENVLSSFTPSIHLLLKKVGCLICY
jgi:hypothetical protein